MNKAYKRELVLSPMQLFLDYKAKLEPFILSYLEKKKQEFLHVNKWADDAFDRLKVFVVQGKMVRGGLVQFAHSLCGENNEDVLKVAAAIELLHSSLLIHDDVIDRDVLRRGESSVFAQYQDLADSKGMKETLHYGNSMAICVGDLCYLLAYDLLAEVDATYRQAIIQFFSTEIGKTVFAQMQDIDLGYVDTCTEDDIMSVYKYKTARYTFSLPMMVGAMVAGANKEVLSLLEKIGNSLGILFQIKDDELGLFADETKLGKPIGSDIKEGKKTLFWYYLMREVSNEEKAKLDGIFGNGLVSEDDIESVRMLLKEKGVMKKVNRKIESLADESLKLISQLDVSEDNKKVLLDLVEYNCTRSY